MKLFLEIIIVITAIVLTFSILFQSGNSAGLSGSIGGGAEQLFGKRKSKGYETILSRITTVCAVIFFICAIAATAIPDGNAAVTTDVTPETVEEVAADTAAGAADAAGTAESAASDAAKAVETTSDAVNSAADKAENTAEAAANTSEKTTEAAKDKDKEKDKENSAQ